MYGGQRIDCSDMRIIYSEYLIGRRKIKWMQAICRVYKENSVEFSQIIAARELSYYRNFETSRSYEKYKMQKLLEM